MTFQPTNFLIVDDDESLVKVFERLAREKQYTYEVARSGQEAIDLLVQKPFEVAVLDVMLPGFSGIQVLEHAKKNRIPTEIIMITGVGTIESAVDAIKKGAYDYLTKPFDDITRVMLLIDKAIERFRLMKQLHRLQRQASDQPSFEGIMGKSTKMQEIFSCIESISGTSSTVLIDGESGTGKELVARAIHRRSPRSEKPFVVINCAAIPENLLESELFGHTRGSFTGAVSDRVGLFEEAHGGTVFLDEIGELPLALQVKLLRVLQSGEVRRIGDAETKKIDIRLLTATNRNLLSMVDHSEFREDLYYRLNVINLTIPPLRERAEDIPLLVYHFLSKCSAKMGKQVDKVSLDALQALQHYSWTGNVRELENAIERAVVLATEDTILARDLPSVILGASYQEEDEKQKDLSHYSYQDAKDRALMNFNRTYIGELLKTSNGNVSVASQKAGMDRSNFKKLIKRYNIAIDSFRDQEELQ
ncbi:MAG: sigma-54-dependent Fis family transcriptional regulator [Deltaproteobacteria bacterium]|nr:sigma-54-dependent Fis family transcriptional regulator [Deltaproteobacteria bacterium]